MLEISTHDYSFKIVFGNDLPLVNHLLPGLRVSVYMQQGVCVHGHVCPSMLTVLHEVCIPVFVGYSCMCTHVHAVLYSL